MVNIIDDIPDNDPHCSNCEYWADEGELFGKCEVTKEMCPSFAICDAHEFRKNEVLNDNTYE